MSELFNNPKTDRQMTAAEVTERRIGGKSFYVETASGDMVVPMEASAATLAPTPAPVAPPVQQASAGGATRSSGSSGLTLAKPLVQASAPSGPPPLPGVAVPAGTNAHAPIPGAALPPNGGQPIPNRGPSRSKRFRVQGQTRIEEYEGAFAGLLLSAFKFPFKGYGIFYLLYSLPCVASLLWGSWYMMIISVGYALAYFAKIISHTRNVEDGVPDFPNLSDWLDDIVRPMFLVGFVVTFAFLPLALYTVIWLVTDLHHPILLHTVLGICMLYLPMGLMSVAVLDSITAINPFKIVRGMMVVGPGYVLAFGVMCAFMVLRYYSVDLAHLMGSGILGFCVISMASFYLLAVEARLLGLLYNKYERNLGWTDYGLPVAPPPPVVAPI